jgi:phospholipase/carboxylesterase
MLAARVVSRAVMRRTRTESAGRLSARPTADPTAPTIPTGLLPLGLGGSRDGWLYVPTMYRPGVPAPLSVKLHGAGGHGRAGLEPFLAGADAAGLILLGIDARGPTWDLIRGGFGDDVDFLDAALHEVFASCTVDPERVSIEGFSDGASYALSLGLANGELFSKIVAFSPGFMAPGPLQGRPAIFVSHGVNDRVLPIDRCSRRIVPELRVAGYPVDYREFDGGHTVPPDLAAEAEAWVVQPKGGES